MRTRLLLTLLFSLLMSQSAFSGFFSLGLNVEWGRGNQRTIGQAHNSGCYNDCYSYRKPSYTVPLRRVEESYSYSSQDYRRPQSIDTCEYYGCEPVRRERVRTRRRKARQNYVRVQDECGYARCVNLNDYKTYKDPDFIESESEVTSSSRCDECGFESTTRNRGSRYEEGEIVHKEKIGSKVKKAVGSLFRLNIGDALYHTVRRRDEIRTGRRYSESQSWDNEYSERGSYGRVAVR